MKSLKTCADFRQSALALLLASLAGPVLATPTGGVVVSGGASISQPSATQTVINVPVGTSIINWTGFNLSLGQSAQFRASDANGPAGMAVAGTVNVLNRISGGQTTINGGALQQVIAGSVVMHNYMVNPNGFVVSGAMSSVSTSSLNSYITLTSADVSDAVFLAGTAPSGGQTFTGSWGPAIGVVVGAVTGVGNGTIGVIPAASGSGGNGSSGSSGSSGSGGSGSGGSSGGSGAVSPVSQTPASLNATLNQLAQLLAQFNAQQQQQWNAVNAAVANDPGLNQVIANGIQQGSSQVTAAMNNAFALAGATAAANSPFFGAAQSFATAAVPVITNVMSTTVSSQGVAGLQSFTFSNNLNAQLSGIGTVVLY